MKAQALLRSLGAGAGAALRGTGNGLERRFFAWMEQSLDLLGELVLITEVAHDGGPNRIVFANQAMLRHTGHRREDLVGQLASVLHGPQTDQEVIQRMRQQLALKQSVRLEVIYHRRDGSPYWAELEIVPIKNGDGEVTHFLSVQRDITDRIEIDRALRDSEERYRSLTELSSDWFWELDTEFRFVRFDGHLPGHFAHEASVGRRPWEVPALNMGPDDWAAHRADLLAHRPFRHMEVHRPRPDGDSMWLEVSGEPMFDIDGAFTGYRGVGRDITDRKRAEVAQREANELLRVSLDNVRHGIAKVDADGRVRYHNRRFLELLDLPAALLAGAPTALEVRDFQLERGDLGVLDNSPDLVLRDLASLGTGAARDHVFVRRTATGRSLEISTQVLSDGGWVRTYVDLTEHLQAQQALRDSEERFRSLTELSSDWYWEQDEQFRYTRLEGHGVVNAELADTFVGKCRWDLPALNMGEDDWAVHRAMLAAHQGFRRLEIHRQDKAGHDFWVAISGVPFFDAEGRFRGYRGVGRNITHRKQAERETLDRLHFSQQLTRNVPGMVYQLRRDLRGRFHFPFLSDGARELYEAEAEAMMADPRLMFARMSVEQQQALAHSLNASADGLSPWACEHRVTLPQRGERWLHSSGRPERQPDGSVVWYGYTSDITERKLDEQRLREANELLTGRTDLLEVTLGSLSQGVVMFDTQGRAVFHNQRFLDLMELPASLMAGKPNLNELVDHQYRAGVFPPGMSREDVSRVYGHMDGQWLISPGQYLREGPDGKVFEIKTSALPSGGWVRTYADVTDYVEAQRALKRGEERLQLMLQGSNDGAWDWNLDTGECYFSPRWWNMLGMHSDERVADNGLWDEFIHPHDTLRVIAEIAQALADNRRSFELEFRMLHRDGSVLTVLDRGFIVRDDNQRAIRVSGTLTDISARKRLEQRLEQSEASLSAFFEAIPDCVWFKDTEGRYVLCNPGKAQLYGTSVERMLGKTETELVPADEAQTYRETDARALQTGQPLVYEEGGVLHGEHRVFEVVKRAVYDNSGQAMGVLGVARDITERKRAEAQIERLAFYDPLTHLCNRRLFQDRLEQAQANSVRSGQWAAVCFIDLDNFKDLNDTLGHDTGDELLRQVGQRLQQVVREQDTVARLGGDEFVVLFEQLGDEADAAALYANTIGQKILSVLNLPYRLADAQHHNTPSIGLTLFRDHNERIEDILKRADLAMYQSKSAGRNTVRFFDPNMQAVVMARSALERDLRQAVAVGQLVLFYQPVVDTAQRVTGFEALVRWRHPQRGMVSPAEFIPVAEQTGLILPIGQWVLAAACEQLARWAADPACAHLTLAVNLSARQLRHIDFVSDVLGVIERSGADPHRLKLELTESLLLHDIEETILKMEQLAERGIRFALDDFGTGYSSLSYLKRLPLSQLKIDQSFVRDLLTDPNDAAIARTILQLAQSLDLDVVAEGVETEGQRQFLQQMGCTAFQGYLFGRPGPLAT